MVVMIFRLFLGRRKHFRYAPPYILYTVMLNTSDEGAAEFASK